MKYLYRSVYFMMASAINELYTPTIAREVPMKIKRRESFSATNASNEAKLAYSN